MHKIDISPELIERLTQERNGRLHIFDEIDPARTAHVIVDLQNGFMERRRSGRSAGRPGNHPERECNLECHPTRQAA